jgi:hypothetical protein
MKTQSYVCSNTSTLDLKINVRETWRVNQEWIIQRHWLQWLKDREEFEGKKGIIIIHISKKNRQHNGQKYKYKRTNNDRQKYTYKTKDRVTQSPQKTGDELRCSGRGAVPAPLVAPVVFYKSKVTKTDIIQMLEFLIDDRFALFGRRVFQQTIDFWIPTVLLFSSTCSFILTRQTSYRDFSRKTKRS